MMDPLRGFHKEEDNMEQGEEEDEEEIQRIIDNLVRRMQHV